MSTLPNSEYQRLVICASHPDTEIWLGDAEGHFVQKAVGELTTSLMPGRYVVEFGLGTSTYPVSLQSPARYTQRQLETGQTCPRPIPQISSGSVPGGGPVNRVDTC